MSGQSRKQQIEQMLSHDPTDSFLRYGLAMEYVAEGNDQQAAQEFERLLAASADYVPGYFQYGQSLIRLGRLEQARTVLQQGTATARRTGDLHAAEEMSGLLATLGD